jgi:glutamine synthetase
MNLSQAKQFIQDNNVKYVLAQFVDIHGVAKTKSVPADHLDMIVNDGAGFAGFAIWGFGMGPHGPDYMAKADLSTLTALPWMPGYARVACDGYVHNKLYPYCSRVALKAQLDALSRKGMTLYTGIEPEFLLLKRTAEGVKLYDETDSLEKPCYDFKGLARAAGFLEQLAEGVKPAGLNVYQIDHEDANGQFEVNFEYSDALTTADRLVLLKMCASEVARRQGLICSFMPKPFSHLTGTGAHFHLSLGDDKIKNLFYDESDKNGLGLSATGYHFVAGLMAHAPALAAIAAPTVNSYKRLVVGRALSGATWAPAYIAYGNNNRTACIRIPYGRIEFRLPDGSCNPYLTTAAILAAGMDGVNRKLEAGAPVNSNLYEWTPEQIAERGIRLLPQNLAQALDALEQDEVIKTALGTDLAAEFLKLKRMEWIEYSRHVSDWERERYVDFF